jgi:hypothetical protein
MVSHAHGQEDPSDPIPEISIREKKEKRHTFTTNPPINLINNPSSNPHSHMIINNLRDPIPTHRPNRPRQPHNITRRRSGRRDTSHHFTRPPLLRDIPVRSLPGAIFAQNKSFARARTWRGFEETGVCLWWAWWSLGEGRWRDVREVDSGTAATAGVGAGEGARWSGGEW